MDFQQLNETACKTYLIASEQNHETMLVDPVLEGIDDYLNVVAERGYQLRYVLDTHVHADHISGAAALRDRTGVDYIMYATTASACANRRVHEGDVLMLGEIPIAFLHTPGHTQDSITLMLPDRLLTGDFLFIGEGGAGRTDLPGGDAGEHWESLKKLDGLPDALLIFPAHDYYGHQKSSLRQERRQNPRLKKRTRAAYMDWLESMKLGPAAWMEGVTRANYACALNPREAWVPVDQPNCQVNARAGNVNSEMVRAVSVERLRREIEEGRKPVLIDVRQRDEFNGELGHLPGSRVIPLGELSKRFDEFESFREDAIVTVCRSGGRSATAAAVLAVAGFKGVRFLEGGMKRWHEGTRHAQSAADQLAHDVLLR